MTITPNCFSGIKLITDSVETWALAVGSGQEGQIQESIDHNKEQFFAIIKLKYFPVYVPKTIKLQYKFHTFIHRVVFYTPPGTSCKEDFNCQIVYLRLTCSKVLSPSNYSLTLP